jgi:hypothetical protein
MERGKKVRVAASGGVALALALTAGWVFLPNTAGYAHHSGEHGGFYRVADVQALAPGATRTGGWNNTPDHRRYFVDVMPYVPEPPPAIAATAPPKVTADEAYPCQIEVVREWRERYVSGVTRLRIWWTIKNVGSQTCSAEVYLGYVENNPVVFPT